MIPETALAPSTLSEMPQDNSLLSPKQSNTMTHVEKASSTDEDIEKESSSSAVSSVHLIPDDKSDDDHSQSYSQLLPMLELPAKSATRGPFRKAINYKAIKVTQTLFSKKVPPNPKIQKREYGNL